MGSIDFKICPGKGIAATVKNLGRKRESPKRKAFQGPSRPQAQKQSSSGKLTKFQWKVLAATATIPLGETRTYQWVAQQVGSPKAVRAVGQALRRNPYPLIIPCHRVIKSDGTLGGYAGGPSDKKEQLLQMEKEICQSWSIQKKK